MNSYLKTCIAEVLLLAALAAPIVIAGCERQSNPPVEPRSAEPSVRQDPGAAPVQTAGLAMDDGAITARVKTALMADEQVKGLAIDVDTKDGQVTLKGELESDDQVTQAVAVARSVDGVKDVINRLGVKGEDKASRSTQG